MAKAIFTDCAPLAYLCWSRFIALSLLLPCVANAAPSAIELNQVLYLEALGKGGPWGLGYEVLLGDRLAFGGVGSFYRQDGRQILSLSPYLTYYPVVAGFNRWLLQAGPQFVMQSTISPVPEWSGTRSTRFGATACAGYEYRDRWIYRAYGMVSMGGDGFAPWMGIDLGIVL